MLLLKMFLRSTNRRKDCKDHRYFSVVENRRLPGGKTAQRTVLHLTAPRRPLVQRRRSGGMLPPTPNRAKCRLAVALRSRTEPTLNCP